MNMNWICFANHDLSYGEVETVFIPAAREYMYLSSSSVREAAMVGARLDIFVDDKIAGIVKEKAKTIKRIGEKVAKSKVFMFVVNVDINHLNGWEVCPQCNEWGTFEEEIEIASAGAPVVSFSCFCERNL